MKAPKYVILEAIGIGSRFFSPHDGSDPTKLSDGSVAYKVLGYANCVHDAQVTLYGECFSHCKYPHLFKDCRAG